MSELTDELDEALAELVSGGFLTEGGQQFEPVYRFRHALIRDAVYWSLLRSERRRLHTRAAWHMEASAGDGLEDDAAFVGQHWAAAGQDDRAIHYFEMAADRAAPRTPTRKVSPCTVGLSPSPPPMPSPALARRL